MAGPRIGVDVGGTFTDVVLEQPGTAGLEHTKAPSTPENPERGALVGIQKILDQTGVTPGDISAVVHGTTVATNAIIEREGARTGMIVTEGYGDLLEIRRQTRPHMYDFRDQREPPVVPRERVHEVGGRLLADGSERDPLDDDEIDAVIDQLLDQNVESIGVSLLHSYLNPSHERQVGDRLAERTDLPVSLSVDILPEFKEYERTSTVALNAYLRPVMDEYIDAMEAGIAELGIDATLAIMQSNGGMMTADAARSNCVQTILSGPAAGAGSGQLFVDDGNFVTADMGGTSFDVGLSIDGELQYKTEEELSGHIVRASMVDVDTVGAGGGSIAWIDAGDALRVGPRSAGAEPGPVAYDRGGTEPTVTDAHVVLGRLNQEALLGGEMAIDLEGAREAVRSRIAEPLGLSLEAAAQGIIDVVNATMVKRMRVATVERGLDPREFTLISFGGAGPLHAAELAAELEMHRAVIPKAPGVNSAVGLLGANYRIDRSETFLETLDSIDSGALRTKYSELESEVIDALVSQGQDRADIVLGTAMAVRYQGQGYELDIEIDPEELETGAQETIAKRFAAAHEREFGFSRPEEAIEIVTLTVTGVVETASPDLVENSNGTGDTPEARTKRSVHVDGERLSVPIYDRSALDVGTTLSGPSGV
ncbi:MAG: hydantoinase/oxoprolinase family protein [Salinirussus sp.]